MTSIRNPTPTEIANLKQKSTPSASEALTEDEVKRTKKQKKEKESISKTETAESLSFSLAYVNEKYPAAKIDQLIQEQILKPKRSQFEPDPVFFKLPSGSKAIDKKFLSDDNEILVRRMASPEEEILIEAVEKLKEPNPSDENFLQKLIEIENSLENAFTKILNNVIKTNIQAEELFIIDKLPLIIFVFAISYDKNIKLSQKEMANQCSVCKKQTEDESEEISKWDVTVDLLSDLDVSHAPDSFEFPFVQTLTSFPDTDIDVVFDFPKIKTEQELNNRKEITAALKKLLLDVQGTKANGKTIEKRDWDDILKFLNKPDKTSIAKRIQDFSVQFGWHGKCSVDCSNVNCPLVKNNTQIEISFQSILNKIIENFSDDENEEDLE